MKYNFETTELPKDLFSDYRYQEDKSLDYMTVSLLKGKETVASATLHCDIKEKQIAKTI